MAKLLMSVLCALLSECCVSAFNSVSLVSDSYLLAVCFCCMMVCIRNPFHLHPAIQYPAKNARIICDDYQNILQWILNDLRRLSE